MIKWEKMGKEVTPEGTTIYYEAANVPISIESRKRHIPHANGKPGTWDHTSYFVFLNGKEVAEKWSLKDAKEYAETLIHKED